LDVAQKVFIDGGPWKVQKIRYLAKYWLLNDKLPIARHGKHQKTIRIIDDEDVAEKCHIWIRNQNFNATPTTFKKFIEQELFPEGEKERVLVVHDECIFYSNDGKRGVWAKTGELPLRKKGNGRSIMVSEFLTEACERIKLDAQAIENYPNIPQEARVYLIPVLLYLHLITVQTMLHFCQMLL